MAGDSMLTGIEVKRIFIYGSIKVGVFGSATTNNMYNHLKPLLKKNPDIILELIIR